MGRAHAGLKAAQPELQQTLVPLLTNLALAHFQLGEDILALTYSVALQQLLFQSTPAEGAGIMADVLNRMGNRKGACVALMLVWPCEFPLHR